MAIEQQITEKQRVHFTDNVLLNATNPITINLIGVGGTGSQVLTALARMNHALNELNHALNELNHAGLQVRVWDDDTISTANLGRQLFADAELGMYKSVALINRVNRFFGTNWKAETRKYETEVLQEEDKGSAVLTISCVDSVKARFEVADILDELSECKKYHSECPKYWLDFGNSQNTGQVLLSSVGKLSQPNTEKYTAVSRLPYVTEEFGDILQLSERTDDTPSSSLADALEKQDLFINSTLAQMASSLLCNLFRKGLTYTRGFFLNLSDFRTQPIRV